MGRLKEPFRRGQGRFLIPLLVVGLALAATGGLVEVFITNAVALSAVGTSQHDSVFIEYRHRFTSSRQGIITQVLAGCKRARLRTWLI